MPEIEEEKTKFYLCPVCADIFDNPVWHCLECETHYEAEGGRCHNCRRSLEGSFQAIEISIALDDIIQLSDWSRAHGYKRGIHKLYLGHDGSEYEGGIRVWSRGYDKIMERARRTSWRWAEPIMPDGVTPKAHIRIVISAIRAGIESQNWDYVAEGQDLLEMFLTALDKRK